MLNSEALILTPVELHNIRRNVQHKFAGLPQTRHAEIVADAVKRIVIRQLPDYEETRKQAITAELVRTIILRESRPLSTEDIYLVSLALSDIHNKKDRSLLLHWINGRLHVHITDKQLARILKSGTGYPNCPVWSTNRTQEADP